MQVRMQHEKLASTQRGGSGRETPVMFLKMFPFLCPSSAVLSHEPFSSFCRLEEEMVMMVTARGRRRREEEEEDNRYEIHPI